MLSVRTAENSFILSLDGRELIRHTPETPALFLGRGEESIRMYRGNFDITDRVRERAALRFLGMEGDTAVIRTAGDNESFYSVTGVSRAIHTRAEQTMDGVVTKVAILGKSSDTKRTPVSAVVAGDTDAYGTLRGSSSRQTAQACPVVSMARAVASPPSARAQRNVTEPVRGSPSSSRTRMRSMKVALWA